MRKVGRKARLRRLRVRNSPEDFYNERQEDFGLKDWKNERKAEEMRSYAKSLRSCKSRGKFLKERRKDPRNWKKTCCKLIV